MQVTRWFRSLCRCSSLWTPRLRSVTRIELHRIKIREFSTVEYGRIEGYVCRLVEQHSSLLEQINSIRLGDSDVESERLYRELANLEPIVNLFNQIKCKEKEKLDLEMLIQHGEPGELEELVLEELSFCREEIEKLEALLIDALVPKDKADQHSAVLELRAGTGGQEAALFSSEMLHLYQSYANFKGWSFEILSQDTTDKGGIKYASVSVSGEDVFGWMKFESGVHRVQRIPQTESSGRIHTSTISVVILPQPTQVQITINPSDLKIETLRASGAGGQHVNTTDSAVRLTHLPTGTVIHIQDERSQHRNRAKALKLLRARLFEKERVEAQRERSEQTVLQIAGGDRSEKIRTYNYPQDRVTDHRLGTSVHGVVQLMAGQTLFDELVQKLRLREKAQAIDSLSNLTL